MTSCSRDVSAASCPSLPSRHPPSDTPDQIPTNYCNLFKSTEHPALISLPRPSVPRRSIPPPWRLALSRPIPTARVSTWSRRWWPAPVARWRRRLTVLPRRWRRSPTSLRRPLAVRRRLRISVSSLRRRRRRAPSGLRSALVVLRGWRGRRIPGADLRARPRAQIFVGCTAGRAHLGVVAVAEPRAAAGLRAGRLAHVAILRAAVSALHGTKITRLHGVPQTAADLAVADAAKGASPRRPLAGAGVAVVAGLLVRANDMVPTSFDGVAREESVQLMAPRVGIGPLAHGVEHFSLDLDVLVADGGMVEGTEDVVNDFVYWDTGIFPGIEDTAGARQPWGQRCSLEGGRMKQVGPAQERFASRLVDSMRLTEQCIAAQWPRLVQRTS